MTSYEQWKRTRQWPVALESLHLSLPRDLLHFLDEYLAQHPELQSRRGAARQILMERLLTPAPNTRSEADQSRVIQMRRTAG